LREQAQNDSNTLSSSSSTSTKTNDGYSRRPETPERSVYSRRDERSNEADREPPKDLRGHATVDPHRVDDRRDTRESNTRDTRNIRASDKRDYEPRDSRRSHHSVGRRDYRERGDYGHDRRSYGGQRRDYGGGIDRRDFSGQSRYRDDRYERRGGGGDRYGVRERDSRGTSHYEPERSSYDQQRSSRYDDSNYNGNGSSHNYNHEDLTNIIPIDKLERKSLWDKKPKGFEKVSSERAKISGLFPLPGEARRVDISKLEGLVSGGDLNSQTSILFEQISIDSLSSRNSKQLIITGVEFTLFPVERLVEYLKNYINSLQIENAFIVNHELLDSKYLVLNLSNSNITTVLFASFKYFQNELNLKIKIDRPQSYITPNSQFLSPEELQKYKIPDSENKIAITNIPTDINEDELLQDLNEISKVSKIDLLKDIEGNSKGIAFVLFENFETEKAIELINKIIIGETTLLSINACQGLPKQLEEITYRNIPTVVKSNTLMETNVLILLNAINPEDLKNEVIYQELSKDIKDECSKYGNVLNVKIPKPSEDYRRNLKSLDTSIGKIFVKFENEEGAKRASKLLNGRKYHERTVLVSFLSESDFNLNLF